MERIVHKSRSFEETDRHDIQQPIQMTLQERMRAVRALKERVYPPAEDVRESHRRRIEAGTRTFRMWRAQQS